LGRVKDFSISACCITLGSGIPRNSVQGGGSTNSVEDRENEDLRAVAP